MIAFSRSKITNRPVTMASPLNFIKRFGIPQETYLSIVSIIHMTGELSNTQKEVVIKLIEKKGKDKRHISNWRPISLINVDTKIGSKAIATRLQKVLPKIIHFNQNAYVKGRTILDAVRTIDDIDLRIYRKE